MDKPLSDNENIDKASTQDTQTANLSAQPQTEKSPVDFKAMSVGAYGPEAAKAPDLTKKEWDNGKPGATPWSSDPGKRLAIRAFSRGVLGAMFFAAGGLYARRTMRGYDASKKYSEINFTEPLQFIAKTIDTFVGKPIELTVHSLGFDGKNAVRFRSTNWSRHDDWGRSLGDEMVKVTFDFFCASVGDAWGRDIAAMVDPNVKKSWLDDKGNFKPGEALKSALKSTWRYVSYNGGEDWAVALPYVYFMRAQRGIINHFSPGFKLDSDRAGNGASFKINAQKMPDGTRHAEIVGNYNKEGAIDFQGRFTAYNVLTMMYREAYNFVANRWKGLPDRLYGAPDAPDHSHGLIGNTVYLAKWFARSVVKAGIIMTPSVPFFWITRVPQSKYKAAFIDPELGHISVVTDPKSGRRGALHVDMLDKPALDPLISKYDAALHREISHGRSAEKAPFSREAFDHTRFEPLAQGKNFDPHIKSFGAVDSIFNAIGKANDTAAKSLDPVAKWANNNLGRFGEGAKNFLNIKDFRTLSRDYVNAAVSYTPYMYAKAEFGHKWDTGKMDLAAERMIDGASSLNWAEFKAGLNEVRHAIMQTPFEDAERETEAKRRIQIDTSAAETFDREQEMIEERERQLSAEWQAAHPGSTRVFSRALPLASDPKNMSSWRDHLVTGSKKEEYPTSEPSAAEKIASRKNISHAEQEAMRKALEELTPPTNSIN